MARLPRFVTPGLPQHVIQRGNNREAVFRAEGDYRFYLEKLRAAADKHDCDIHAYVLMTNHVHLLLTSHSEDGIGKMMQMLGALLRSIRQPPLQPYRHAVGRALSGDVD